MAEDSSSVRDNLFWDTHQGVALAWSNPHASDSVMIAKALLSPSFHRLLDIAAHFGLDRLKAEWEELRTDLSRSPWPENQKAIRRAEPTVSRCLWHMEMAIE